MKKNIIVSCLILFLSCSSSFATDYPTILVEAWDQLDEMFSPEDIQEIQSQPEDYMALYHFSFGMFIRNQWVRHGDGRLTGFFRNYGIYHPDDISSLILRTYWCYKNELPLNLDERVEEYKIHWENIQEKFQN